LNQLAQRDFDRRHAVTNDLQFDHVITSVDQSLTKQRTYQIVARAGYRRIRDNQDLGGELHPNERR
jgi:hypothetical protein